MDNYINDIEIVIEAINNGDKRDAIQMLKEMQDEFKTSLLINLNYYDTKHIFNWIYIN